MASSTDSTVAALEQVPLLAELSKRDRRRLAQTMTDHRVRHVPVVDDGRLIGIVSIGDVVKARLDELEAERASLVDYIQTA